MDLDLEKRMGRLISLAARNPANTPPCVRPPKSADLVRRLVLREARRSGVPARFLAAGLDDFPVAVSERTEKFLSGPAQGIFIFGGAGVGKTHLCAALLKEHLAGQMGKEIPDDGSFSAPSRDRTCFVAVPDLLLGIRSAFAVARGNAEGEAVRRCSEADLLVLDDLGAEKPSEWSNGVLYLIVNARYSAMRKTIVSSNFTLDEVGEKIGDRIASRLAGMGSIIQLLGPDRRLGEQAKLW